MASYIFQKGAADKTVYLRALISGNGTTAGDAETTLVFNTAGLSAHYIRNGAAASTITLATQTAGGAHADGGFVHLQGGTYRLDLPDAAIATGVDYVTVVLTKTGVAFEPVTIVLTADDPHAAGATLTQIIDGLLNELLAGHTTAGTVGKALSDIDTSTGNTETTVGQIDARIPAALVNGHMPASVQEAATNSLTAAALAADAVNEIADGTLTRAMAEAYSTDGGTLTPAQALYELVALLTEFAKSGTTVTVKKRDGTTTALTLTVDDATNPTSIARTG